MYSIKDIERLEVIQNESLRIVLRCQGNITYIRYHADGVDITKCSV